MDDILTVPFAGLLLLKAAFVGITLMVDAWLVTLWGQEPDSLLRSGQLPACTIHSDDDANGDA